MTGPGDSDRLLKRLYLVIGFVALPVLLIGIYSLIREAMWEIDDSPEWTVAAPPTTTEQPADVRPRAVRFELAEPMQGTDSRIILVRHGMDYQAREYGLSGIRGAAAGSPSGGGYENGPIVNVMVVGPTANGGRLIFDRAVFIRDVVFPPASPRVEDSAQTWIAYELATDDGDQNGRLDAGDPITLYVSDLDGSDLRRVLPDGWTLLDQIALPDRRTLFITALQRPARSDREWEPAAAPQRAFLYDVTGNQLRPAAEIDSLATRAATLLAAPSRR